jgi:hypothetical protein
MQQIPNAAQARGNIDTRGMLEMLNMIIAQQK